MKERRAFRETVRNAGKKTREIARKLNPEPAISKFMLNHKVRKLLVRDGDKIDWNAIEELVEAGASPDVKCRWGHPMLVDAARAGRIDVCKFLLEKGARVGARDSKGKTALAAALETYKKKKDFSGVRLLLENGADIETAGDYLGSTALAIAISNQNIKEMRYLVEKGADVNTRTFAVEKTALMSAAEKGDLELCRLLLRKGADVDAADHYSKDTALLHAMDNGHVDVAKLLVMYGADIYSRNMDLESADSTAYRKMPNIEIFFKKVGVLHNLLSNEKDGNKGSVSGFAESLGYANGGSYKIFMSNFAECVGA